MRAWTALWITAASALAAGPERGFVSLRPAAQWEQALVSGNGTIGALVMSRPIEETIIFSRARLFMPRDEPRPPVETAPHLAELRRMLAGGRYEDAARLVVALGAKEGYDRKWMTDPLVPAFDLRVRMDGRDEDVRDYRRSVDFQTGVATVEWSDPRGRFVRRLFVSRPARAVVLSIEGPGPGQLNCSLELSPRPVDGAGEQRYRAGVRDAEATAEPGWLTYRSSFRKPWKGSIQGYEGVARVIASGGSAPVENGHITVRGADRVLVIIRLEVSYDWSRSALPEIKTALEALPADFAALLAPHARVHGELFNRVRLDLGGGAGRGLSSEDLIAGSRLGKLSPALVERLFDAGRYLFISSTGELPPTLQGIWAGTWSPRWSSDFTQNGNVASAIASGLSGNTAELMLPYFDYVESLVPAMRENARRHYGCRGILMPSRTSSHGFNVHFSEQYPMTFWTAGAGWAAHFFYDYWLYTGDREFLARRAHPFMKEAAAFYQDFLVEDGRGQLLFSPSYSPENNPGNSKSQAAVNATMDIAVATELLTNLIAAARELGADREAVARWRGMLAKMPAYMINRDGAVKEWTHPELEDNYAHRHASHLYALFDGMPPEIAPDPKLVKAFERAVEKRLEWRRATNGGPMAFGFVQLGLAAASLRRADLAYDTVDWLANAYWFPSLAPSHDPGKTFNVDIAGGLPAVIIKMLLASEPGAIDLLPALPRQWPSGRVEGLPCRGQVLMNSLAWSAKRIEVTLRASHARTVRLRAPGEIASISGAEVDAAGSRPDTRMVSLPAGRDVTLSIRLR